VSGCDTYGHLIGGYVLGALEPEEADELRAHMETCRDCAREHAELAGIPALLDGVEPADVPPPAPPPRLEEAVLDRVARERHAAAPPRPRRRRRLWPRVAVAGAATALAAAAIAIAVVGGGDDQPDYYARGTLKSHGAASGYFGVTEVPGGTRVALRAEGMKRSPGGYELWCVRKDGKWVSGGTFSVGRDGRADAELTAAVEPGDYHKVVITRDGEGAGGYPVLSGPLRY
jgi:anti-sigma factor RsiW